MLIECCVDDLDSALIAQQGGVDRLELCDNLGDGGTTPSHGILSFLLDTLDIPVFPIVRVRGGSFVYSREERRVMARDVAHARALGARGVVVGALTPAGDVDREALEEIVLHDADVEVTFHRAFDVCRDPIAALDTLIELGVDRILTSGQAPSAWEGRDLIAELVRRAGADCIIMAGGGVREDHAAELAAHTGVQELHVRCTTLRHETPDWIAPAVPFRKPLPTDETARWVTDPDRLAALRRATGRRPE